ncbi:MAG: hypothetical protein FWH38_01420 [Treponema sp.]|nr:hypothetical protein [Treponema sp.]
MGDPLLRWLAWFDIGSPPELVAEVVKMDGAIQTADERMAFVTGDKEAMRAYRMRQMALSDLTSYKNYAWDTGFEEGKKEGLKAGKKEGLEKGIKEGIKEGLKEGREETARKALAKGLSIETIRDITGFDIETIKGLSGR